MTPPWASEWWKADDEPSWFSVRCHFLFQDPTSAKDMNLYEERITLWRSDSAEEAIALAEDDANRYASGFEDFPVDYLWLAQSYYLADSLGSGAEVYSLCRDSDRTPAAYLAEFFDTGTEAQTPREPGGNCASTWYSVRCVLQSGKSYIEELPFLYEERITVWEAGSERQACAMAVTEAKEYAEAIEDDPDEYVGLAQCFPLSAPPEHGRVIFSLRRVSKLEPEDYLTAHFDTGWERHREIGD